MNIREIIETDKKYFMNTFGDRTPVCFEYGKGMHLWDTDGKKYTDFLAGIAVSGLGHSHPALVNAIREQAGKVIHTSSLYYIEKQALLAKKIVEISCADKVFLANSGAEANEGAIKLARIFFKKRGEDHKYDIITLKKSFHGRTLTTTAATGQQKYQGPYVPLTPGFRHVAGNDIEALKAEIDESTCAVMLEPIQGEGGVNLSDYQYLKDVRELCDKFGIFLIVDEIQTGMGRTGKLFGYEHFDIKPDIFTLAKELGGGFPIGALCARGKAAGAFEPGDHGSTFGGNPLACAAALAVIETMEKEKLVENSYNVGNYFMTGLKSLALKHPVIGEVRGMGLMLGMQLKIPKAVEIRNKCFDRGWLVGSIGNNIIRMLPPLIVTKKDVDGLLMILDEVISETEIPEA
ncbi:MAG: aspartate aminotransferase family protein [Eubacteriales bacterium]|nr:aspartate aminotransferase family protein [Eubacteriales bacterium]